MITADQRPYVQPLRGSRQVLPLVLLRHTRLRNRFRATHPTNWIRLFLRLAFLGPILVLLVFSCILASAIGFEQAPSLESANDLFASMLVISFTTMLAGCLGVSLQTLYFSREGDFLLTLPLSFRLIVLARTGDFARGAAPGTLFGLATMLGYTLARARWTAAAGLALPGVLILAGLAIGIAVALTAAIVLITPARITRHALTIMGLVTLGSAAWSWQALGRPYLIARERRSSASLAPWLEWLPPVWIARGIADASAGSVLPAALYGAIACATFALAMVGAARLYEATFGNTFGIADVGANLPAPRRFGHVAQALLRILPRSVIHWVRREWTLIGRDFGRVSAAVWPVSTILLLSCSTLLWNRDPEMHYSDMFWRSHAPVLLLPWAISLGTTIFAIGSEAHAFGLARSLPIRASTMMIGKFAAYAIPTALISTSVGILSLAAAPGDPADSSLLILLLIWLACGSCAIDLAMSAAAPRFGAEPIQRSTPILTRILAGAFGLLSAMLAVITLAISPIGNASIGTALGIETLDLGTGGWAFALLIALLVPVTMLVTGTRRIALLIAGA